MGDLIDDLGVHGADPALRKLLRSLAYLARNANFASAKLNFEEKNVLLGFIRSHGIRSPLVR